jgi:hypothetical protein
MFITSTLSSLPSGITFLKLQNKVTKIPICLTLLFTTLSVLLKVIVNSIIYPTRSQGSLIIGSTILLSAPSGCDFGGESLTFSTKTFGTSMAFTSVSKLS